MTINLGSLRRGFFVGLLLTLGIPLMTAKVVAQQLGAQLTPLGRVPTARPPLGLEVQGDHAFLVTGESGLMIVDVRNPDAPVMVGHLAGSFTTSGSSEIGGIRVAGDYAYTASYLAGLQIFEVRNREEPVRVGGYRTNGFRAYKVWIDHNCAFLSGFASSTPEVRLVKVVNPLEPQLASVIPGEGAGLFGGNLYVWESSAVLKSFDVSDPDNPKLLGTLIGTATLPDVPAGMPLAYLPSYFGLDVINVADPRNLQRVGRYGTATYATYSVSRLALEVAEPYVFIAHATDYFNPLEIADVSDPAAPRRAEGIEAVLRVRGVQVRGDLAYVVAGFLDRDFDSPGFQVFRLRTGMKQLVTFLNPFESLTSYSYTNAPFPLRARSSSGLPITFRVASGPGVLEGDQLRFIGSGTIRVVAEQAGTDRFLPRAVTNRMMVSPNQTLKWLAPTAEVLMLNTPHPLRAECEAGVPVSYRVVYGPARVEGGQLIITNVGSVRVAAELATAEFYATPMSRDFNPVEVTFKHLGGFTNALPAQAIGVTVAGSLAYVAEGTNGSAS